MKPIIKKPIAGKVLIPSIVGKPIDPNQGLIDLRGLRFGTISIILGLLVGCASGGPVPMGGGNYYLTKKSAGCGFTGGEGSKVKLLREANTFCAKQGQELETVEATSRDGVPMVRCASAQVQFRCASRANATLPQP
jgi:hypothetical protein